MLPPGTTLGPYEILAQIGAGGMGEVYRALDTRLGRQVAVKVLSRSYTNDAEATRRFEQEARAAGMLNHPNIVSLYDIGSEGPIRYIVSELLQGESMRQRIRQGPIPARKAVDYAVQVARGLAAAHEKGIIHRDLKPENLFITRDGQVKILDFGLVKLIGGHHEGPAVDEHAITLAGTPTEPGRLLGTVGYMAPEQIRGQSGDHRSDLFAFGAILFEMVSGRQAFRGDSPIETLNSILKDEPPEFYELDVRIPSALERVIRHCLEKNPDERFQSARDLAFDIGAMSGLTSQVISYPRLLRMRARHVLRLLAFAAIATLALGAAYWFGTRRGQAPPPTFQRLTFRGGTLLNARFGPDGQTIFYGARWGGNPVAVYTARPDSPESRDLGFSGADLLAVSTTGQLAISLRRHPIGYLRYSGTLARVPITGGAPREVLDDVEAADWHPDGEQLAIVRMIGGRSRVEFPIGKVLYSTVGWISHPRFRPDGKSLAFIDHPFLNDDRGAVALVPVKGGEKRALTPEYQAIEGLAWSADGDRLWFGADRNDSGRSISTVDLRGHSRVITNGTDALWLHDVDREGRALVSHQSVRAGIMAILPGETKERDLSWLDYSVARDLSADGKTVLFSESGEAGGSIFGIYTRSTDGSTPAIRLGEGTTEGLSPDGKWVLSISRNQQPPQVMMLPIGAGQPRAITRDRINHRNARWFPDGRHILFQGNEPGKGPRLWVQAIDGTPPRAISPENVSGHLVTADGRRVLGRDAERQWHFYPVDGGQPEPVPALHGPDVPIRFTSDGRSVYVGSFGRVPAVLYKVDLATGRREVAREAMPADPSGLINVGPILTTADGSTAIYSYTRLLSDLYLMDRPR
ncbi:MAG TPA: protein kinase [Thermoanaerobaculia bacterium]|jgi:Tol biopolymer transport system component|nr:protein kinase [Thermoanaerobaculia bacterium]